MLGLSLQVCGASAVKGGRVHKATASLIHHPGSTDWKGEGIDMEREGVGVRDSWLSGALNGLVRAGESILTL